MDTERVLPGVMGHPCVIFRASTDSQASRFGFPAREKFFSAAISHVSFLGTRTTENTAVGIPVPASPSHLSLPTSAFPAFLLKEVPASMVPLDINDYF